MNELKIKFGIIILLVATSLMLTSDIIAQGEKIIMEKSFNVFPGELLYVKASGAEIKLNSWDKNEVYIKVYGNKKAENNMHFEIYKEDKEIRVFVRKKFKTFFNLWTSVLIEAYIPEDFHCKVTASGGDISVKNIKGNLDLNTSGGDITLDNLSGDIAAKTSGGDIKINNTTGKLDVTTSGGDITCKKFDGELNAFTSGGDIMIDSANGFVDTYTTGGNIIISWGKNYKGMKAKTTGGDITIFLPSLTKASLEAETTGGDIDCEFQNSKAYKVTHKKMIADFNGGGHKLIAKTTGGNIIINEK